MIISRFLAFLCLLSVSLAPLTQAADTAPDQRLQSVLIFSKTAGWVHESIPAGVAAVTELVEARDLTPVATDDANIFTDDKLQQMAAVVFVNTTGDILNDQQQLAMERYIQAGGGFVGIHAAADTEREGGWHWYRRLVGAAFESHPSDPSNVQRAKVKVVDSHHPATQTMPHEFSIADEWYDFSGLSDLRQDLLVVDERSYQGGSHGAYHPIAWYQAFDGGRSFYTGLGHTKQTFSDPRFLQHLAGGLDYAIGERQPLDYTAVRPDPRRFAREVLVDNLDEPVSFDVTDDYAGAMIAQRQGKLFWLDVASRELQTMAEFDVFAPKKKIEFGLVAVAFDPGFKHNNQIYVMYNLEDESGQAELLQRVAQFSVNNKKVDLASEQVLLDIPMDNTCCHTGGNLEFDNAGNLFIAIGDNSNPFESNDSGPMNNKPDGTYHDALRSAANTQDLRGKILRIHPDRQGGYQIPEGNLFSSPEQGRPEIYVMGTRNPYTIAIDESTGDLYYGDIGPDAKADSDEFGPRGYDEINKVTEPGFFGWPTMLANNKPYRMYDYQAEKTGKFFDPLAPQNFSPRNTGLDVLPPAQPALMWYPYAGSERFPELGQGGRNALVAGIYPKGDDDELAYPRYYQNKLFIGDFMRSWIKVVTLDDDDNVVKIDGFAPTVKFAGPLDMRFTKDGRLWVLEYGTQWWAGGKDAKLSFISYDPDAELVDPVIADSDASGEVAGGVGHEVQLEIAQGKDLTESTSCIACHKENAASVGPSFLQVKQKYSTLEDPKAYIANTIAQGSRGKWGDHVMPAHSFLDQATRDKIAAYILSVTAE
ncbi:ThuA domain-containing protein [uncultured Gilvimarinus sp.]|uniref:ThuA domain-containing protein n=1 Tax=uncultured Gilvimarinus sp. TaxID=1689143 RepID=UPI0030EDCF28|tara:strand:+ start:6867 stop:9317 length:2451 start_codon:yes stop_codon:yes gene_type:complete